jgi:hypothetical protein
MTRYIEYFLGSIESKAFPLDEFPTLAELCKAALRRFSRKNLQQSRNERQLTIPSPRPPEAQFQDEFYRALRSLLGNGASISSEWSRDYRGRIDFRISVRNGAWKFSGMATGLKNIAADSCLVGNTTHGLRAALLATGLPLIVDS